jgi:hypothetical protein
VGIENFDVWAELDGSSGSNVLTTRRFYGDGIDTPTARINYTGGTGAVAWYFQDVRGSITAVANASGTIKATIHYDGYGNATIDSGSADSPGSPTRAGPVLARSAKVVRITAFPPSAQRQQSRHERRPIRVRPPTVSPPGRGGGGRIAGRVQPAA